MFKQILRQTLTISVLMLIVLALVGVVGFFLWWNVIYLVSVAPLLLFVNVPVSVVVTAFMFTLLTNVTMCTYLWGFDE